MAPRTCCALIGCGTVGTGVVRLWRDSGQAPDAMLKTVVVRDLRKPRGVDLSGVRLKDDPFDSIRDPEIGVVVEATGDTELGHALARDCLPRGQSFVTAGKALVALHGLELEELARAHGAAFRFEAAVGGALPVVTLLRLGLSPGRVRSLEGVLNGTCNFILSRLGEGLPFEAALEAARGGGFAEPDSSRDVSGRDAAEKLVILARLCGVGLAVGELPTAGIAGLHPGDVAFGRRRGWSLRLVAGFSDSGAAVQAGVGPAFVDQGSLLAQARDEENVVVLDGGGAGRIGLIGRGAGSLPTASAVLSDVREVLRGGPAPALLPLRRLPLLADPSRVRHYLAVPRLRSAARRLVSALSAAGVGVEVLASECPGRVQALTTPAPTLPVARAVVSLGAEGCVHAVVRATEAPAARSSGIGRRVSSRTPPIPLEVDAS